MEYSFHDRRPAPLIIGKVEVSPPLILAPMAGVTDDVFRSLAADHGAGLVTTEMISAEGLKRLQPATLRLYGQNTPLNAPLSVQLFGRDPATMAEAAKIVESNGADLVDINAGCPVKKIVKQGAGAYLLKAPDHLAFIIEKVKGAIGIPVTVKLRLGWNHHSVNIIEVAKRAESAGADAVAVHARTAAQLYSGRADWSWIEKTKVALNIPVIGNGDVTSSSKTQELLQKTACDAVMVGRAAIGNPWIFATIAQQWGFQPQLGIPEDSVDFLKIVRLHYNNYLNSKHKPYGHCRQILIWYSKSLPESARLRAQLYNLAQPMEMLDCFSSWLEQISDQGFDFKAFKKLRD